MHTAIKPDTASLETFYASANAPHVADTTFTDCTASVGMTSNGLSRFASSYTESYDASVLPSIVSSRSSLSCLTPGAPSTIVVDEVHSPHPSFGLGLDAQASRPLLVEHPGEVLCTPGRTRPGSLDGSESDMTQELAVSKPFPCPRPTCTKAYKQSKGLRYHMTRGRCSSKPPGNRAPAWQAMLEESGITGRRGLLESQRSKAETEGPVLPYACTVGDCTRSYKTFAGLKYHYFHSGHHGFDGLQLLAGKTHECLPLLSRRVRQTAIEQATLAIEALRKRGVCWE